MKKVQKLSLLTLLVFLFIAGFAYAQEQTIVGKWKTIDDKTNQPKSIVEIFEKDGKYFGKILQLFRGPDEDQDPICDKCADDDPRKGQKIIGMEFLKDLEKKGDMYSGGTVLDADEGKIYKCKIWLEGDDLKIRGYIAFFYRTQTWLKAE